MPALRLPKFIVILIITVCNCHHSFSQDSGSLKNRLDTVARLKALITQDKLLSSAAIGPTARASKPFFRFLYLYSIAEKKDLVEMTKDSSRYLRIYGYIGLLHQNAHELKKSKRKLSKDKAPIEIRSGCGADQLTISQAIEYIYFWYERSAFDSVLLRFKTDNTQFDYSMSELLTE